MGENDIKLKNEPSNINLEKQRHYEMMNSESNERDASTWIAFMRVVAWLSFIAIMISGIVYCYRQELSFEMWALVLIGFLVIGLAFVAMIMIFLNVAENISDMKDDVSKIKKYMQRKSED